MWLQSSLAGLLLGLASGEAHRTRFQPFKFDDAPLVVEQFADRESGLKWIGSEAHKRLAVSPDGDQHLRYSKDWAIEEATVYAGFDGDKGLVLKSPDQYYAISAALAKPILFGDRPVVIQYEVKFQEGIECGGAYLKLFRAPLDARTAFVFRPERVDDQTPFSLMFGPDRCGSSDEVHFIIQHLNRRTGTVQEKKLKEPPMIRSTKLSSLYTLVVRPDGTFDILINREIVRSGHLHTDLDPPLKTPAEIDDPKDVKPETWVDEEKIPDPTAVKPIDWDESIPPLVEDSDAKRPEGWLEHEPEMVPDPSAQKPPAWEEAEDGVWEAPLIINPKCTVGCGKWVPPLRKNPLYKGPWTPPLIDNPAYRGPWAPHKMPNAEYFVDDTPAAFLPAIGVGFELYTMQAGVLFDNLLITHDEEEAVLFAEATWTPKYDLERLALETELQAQGISDEPPFSLSEEDPDGRAGSFAAKGTSLRSTLCFLHRLATAMHRNYREYWERLRADPYLAVREHPMMTVNMALLSLTLAYLGWAVIFMLTSGRSGGRERAGKKDGDRVATVQSIVKTRMVSDIADMTLSPPLDDGQAPTRQQEAPQDAPRMRRVPSQIPRPISPLRPLKILE